MKILTTEEVAQELGVRVGTVWQMVQRGKLTPLRPNAKPALFRLWDVIEAGEKRITKAQHERLDALAQRLRDMGENFM